MYRLIKVYHEKGKEGFVHGNRGRKPVSTIPDVTRDLVLDLHKTKYYEANFTHFTELLERIECIKLSVSTVTSILEADYILSPRVTKAKLKRLKKELKAKQNTSKTKKEAAQVQANLVVVENAHSRRPRCAYFGDWNRWLLPPMNGSTPIKPLSTALWMIPPVPFRYMNINPEISIMIIKNLVRKRETYQT